MGELEKSVMRWLLDTNVWIDAAGGLPDARQVLSRARDAEVTWAGNCSITLVEALGFANLTDADALAFRKIFGEFHEVEVASDIIEQAVQIRRSVRLKTPDALIAASALIFKATLITRNTVDFKNIPNLQLLHTDQI